MDDEIAAPATRRFYLYRAVDDSGFSGTGIVCFGCVLPSGRAVMEWRQPLASISVYASVDELVLIHGHDGHTRLVWID